MSWISFLTEEQCKGETTINILQKRGRTAEITDFSVLLGGAVNEHGGNRYERTGFYWTKSSSILNNVLVIGMDGTYRYAEPNERFEGARPVLPSSYGQGKVQKKAKDGIVEVEYGYYPQTAVSNEMQKVLESKYKGGELVKTGNRYTTDSSKSSQTDKKFSPKQYEEFEYNGKRYVRIVANSVYKDERFTLSNGMQYKTGDIVWVEVEPVKWLIDEKAGIMITDKIIFSGIQFKHDGVYHNKEEFVHTDIKQFIDRYFAAELVQPRNIGKHTGTTPKAKEQTVTAPKPKEQTVTAPKPKEQAVTAPKPKEQTVTEPKEKRRGNPYKLDFSNVSEEDIIIGAIQSNIAVFLHGKSGCGKSARVRELDPDYIELNLSNLDPELLDGMGGERDGKAVHIKPAWLEELEEKCEAEPDKIHIVFLEELTNATDMMQKKAFGIALDKKVAGKWRLPENARVVAAGNEIEDSILAMELSEPLFGRFAHVYIETDAEKWLKYAMTPNSSYEKLDYRGTKKPEIIHPAIYAFISSRRDKVLRTAYDREHPKPFADPRRWEMASDMLYGTNNPNTLRAIIGKELTMEFIKFCTLATITVEDVLEGNYTEEDILEMDLEEKLSTVAGLTRVGIEDFEKVREFVKKLGPEICRQFELLWAGGDEERLEKLQEIITIEREKRAQGHRGGEAVGAAGSGIIGFKRIEGAYGEYMSREDAKEDKDTKEDK